MVNKLPYKVDLKKIKSELSELIPTMESLLEVRQMELGLKCRANVTKGKEFLDSTGPLNAGVKEADFCKIVPGIQNLYIGELFEKVAYPIGRAKIQKINAGTTGNLKYHHGRQFFLSLQASSECYLVEKKTSSNSSFVSSGNIFHIPPDEYLYDVDATRSHFLVNNGNTDQYFISFFLY